MYRREMSKIRQKKEGSIHLKEAYRNTTTKEKRSRNRKRNGFDTEIHCAQSLEYKKIKDPQILQNRKSRYRNWK